MAYTVCTALIQRNAYSFEASTSQRLALLKAVLTTLAATDVLLLQGGFFFFNTEPAEIYPWIAKVVVPLVNELSPNTTVVFGVDARVQRQRHEVAVAVSGKRIKAVGRKFHASPPWVVADSPWGREEKWGRTFTKRGRRYYLAVCYDSFGLRKEAVQMDLPIDAVLNTIHYFKPAGESHGGDVYFARHGLAGAARHWQRPVFGAAHFLRPRIPQTWPSGVRSK